MNGMVNSGTSNLILQPAKERIRSVEGSTLFLLGALSSLYVGFIGQLYISEIILLLLFPFLWFRMGSALLKDRLAGRILLYGSLWFASQVFTDIFQGTPVNDMLRGWAGILVLLVAFSTLYLLIRRSLQRIKIFLLGYILGNLVSLYLQPSAYFRAEPWKFGFGYPVALLALLIILHLSGANFGSLKKSILPLLLLGGLSIYLNARSLGAIIVLTAIILWLRNRTLGKSILTRISPQSIFAGLLVLGLTIWGLASIYGFAAQKGYLGEEARLKYVWQGSGQFGLILGGRSEILASAIAIRDSPIIGHGSWAQNPSYRVFLYRLIDLGYQHSQEEIARYVYQSDLIPAHSHIFQAWVWAGVLGAVFWVMVLGLIFKVLVQSNRFPNSLYIFVIFFSISAVWDIFFSPFGSIMRLRWAVQFVILITAYYQSRKIEQSSQPVYP